MANTNGGIIGKSNNASFGKNVTTVKTSTGSVTLQSGTRLIQTAIVSGGGAGGKYGGGGAGGVRNLSSLSVQSSVPITIGGGGTASPPSGNDGSPGVNSSIITLCGTHSSTGGGTGRGGDTPSNGPGTPGGSGGGGSYWCSYWWNR